MIFARDYTNVIPPPRPTWREAKKSGDPYWRFLRLLALYARDRTCPGEALPCAEDAGHDTYWSRKAWRSITLAECGEWTGRLASWIGLLDRIDRRVKGGVA